MLFMESAITISQQSSIKKVWQLLEGIADPEIPVLSVLDLGIVRSVGFNNENKLQVIITPTYSGCPAMDIISINIRLTLASAGFKDFEVKQTLNPPWTTDWMTESGKERLRSYGIAPPKKNDEMPACPQCKSIHTKLLSQFGSTACKALYQCDECREPFDYFKCH